MIVVLAWLATGYRGHANLVPMLVPPIAIGLLANKGRSRRTLAAFALTIVHAGAVSILGVVVIGH